MDYSQYFDYDKIRAAMVAKNPAKAAKYGPPSDKDVEGLLSKSIDRPEVWGTYAKSTKSALQGRLVYLSEKIDSELSNAITEKTMRQAMAGFAPTMGQTRAKEFITMAIGVAKGKEISDKIEPLLKQRKLLSQLLSPASIGHEGSWGEKYTSRDFNDGTVSSDKTNTFLGGVAGSALLGGSHGSYFGLVEPENPMDDTVAAETINQMREVDPFFKSVFKEPVAVTKPGIVNRTIGTVGYVTGSGPEFLSVLPLVRPIAAAASAIPGVAKAAAALAKTGTVGRGAVKAARHAAVTAPQFAAHSVVTGSPENALSSAVTGAFVGATGGIMPKGLGAVGGGAGFAVPMALSELVTTGDISPENFASNFVAGAGLWFTHLPGKAKNEYQQIRDTNEFIKQQTGGELDIVGSAPNKIEGYKRVRAIIKEQKRWAEEKAKAAENKEWNDILGIKEEPIPETPKETVVETTAPQPEVPKPPQVPATPGVDIPKPVNIYYGANENPELSNFAVRPFELDGKKYSSVEQYFQMAKLKYATGDNTSIAEELAGTQDGGKLKFLGKRVSGLDTDKWDSNAAAEMEKALRASFQQNPDAKNILLATGNAPLTHAQDKTKWGQEFPRLLMKIRDELSSSIPKPESMEQWLPRIVTTRNTEPQEQQIYKAREFVDAVSKSEAYTPEQRIDLFKYLNQTAKSAGSRNAFVRMAKEHLGTKYAGLDSYINQADESALTQLYNAYQRVPFGQPGQLEHLTIGYGTEYANGKPVVAAVSVTPTRDVARKADKYNPLEHTSDLSETYGSNVAVIDGFYNERKQKDQKFHEVDPDMFKQLRRQLSEQGYLNMIFRSDSGNILLLKEHPQMKEKAKEAYDEIREYIDKGLESDDVQEYATPEDARAAYAKQAVNLHLYLKDELGSNYLQQIEPNGWKSVQDLIKRSQIFSARGVKLQSDDVSGLNLPVIDGKPMIPVVIVEDKPEKENTDGRGLATPGIMAAYATSLGVEPNLVNEPTNNVKPFITFKHPELGSLLGKLSNSAPTPAEREEMRQAGLDGEGIMLYKSSAKWMGARKIGEKYYISPESIRLLDAEHFDLLDDTGNPKPTYIPSRRQKMYYADAPVMRTILDHGAVKLEKELADIDTPEKFAKWFEERVMKRLREDTDEDGELDTEAEIMEANGPADKVLQSFDYSAIGMNMPFAKSYYQAAIKKYIMRSLIAPEVRGHMAYFQGMPSDIAKIAKNPDEIVLGSAFRHYHIADMIEKDTIDIFDGDKRITHILDRNKIQTMGDLYKVYPNARVMVTAERSPIEDIGGIRSNVVVGLGPEGTGFAYYAHGREMRSQGGADNDIDKTAISFERGQKWRDTLLKRYNNADYIPDQNAIAEYAVQNNVSRDEAARRMAGEEPTVAKVTKIISGGQTGGDFGGLLAGKELGLETGGWIPKGWRTEDGPKPELGKEYGLKETDSTQYPDRTMRNVDSADGTIAFLWGPSVGTSKTIGYAHNKVWHAENTSKDNGHKPVLVITTKDAKKAAQQIADFVQRNNIKTLNIAGHRETSQPGIQEFVRQSLVDGLKRTPQKEKPAPDIASIFNPYAMLRNGQSVLNAKSSIGYLMSFDRVLRTLAERKHPIMIDEYVSEPVKEGEVQGLTLQGHTIGKKESLTTTRSIDNVTSEYKYAYKLTIPGFDGTIETPRQTFKDIDLYVVKDADGDWSVIDKNTGLRVSDGFHKTRKAAIESTVDRINSEDARYNGDPKQQTTKTVMKKVPYYIPTGEQYDGEMKYYKKLTVDAKHGGGMPFQVMRREIVDRLVGVPGAADILLGKGHYDKKAKQWVWDIEPDPVYSDIRDMYSKVFSYNFKEERNWTPEETRDAISGYFSKYEPQTQLEKVISKATGPLSIEFNPIEQINTNDLKARAESVGTTAKPFSLDKGGLKYSDVLKRYSMTNSKAIDTRMTINIAGNLLDTYATGYQSSVKPDAPYAQMARDRQGRALARLETLAERMGLGMERGENESANQYGARLVDTIRKNLSVEDGKYIAQDMLKKANDFVFNDVHTIASEERLRMFELYVPKEQQDQIYKLTEEVTGALDDMRTKKIHKNQGIAIIENAYTKLDDMMKAEPDNKNLEGFIGTLIIGSPYRPERGMSDVIRKIGWSRWEGSWVLKGHGQRVNQVWKDVTGGFALKAKRQPLRKELEESPIGAVDETQASISKAEQIRRNDEMSFDTVIAKIGGSKLMPTDPEVRKAKRAVVRLINNPFSTWRNAAEFIDAILQRPEGKRNYTKYPMDKVELAKVVDAARQFDRAASKMKKGNSDPMAWFIWNHTTGETMARTTPWTFDWFKNIVRVYNQNEASFSYHSTTISELVNEAYTNYGTPQRLGEILYDIHTEQMPKEQVMAKYGLGENEYNEVTGSKVLGKYTDLMDRLWIIIQKGHEYHKRNVKFRMRKAGRTEDEIAAVMAAMKLQKVPRYFPRYVEMLEGIIEGKAMTMAEAIANGEMRPADVAKQYGIMHTRHRSNSDMPIEKDLEKVLNTYIGKIIPWAQRQQTIYHTHIIMDQFAKEINRNNDPKMQESLIALQKYYYRVSNDLVGNSSRYLDTSIVQNETGGYDMKYTTPGGEEKYLSLNTTDEAEATRRMYRYKIDPDNQIVNNVSNAMLAMSFAKNIGLSIGSAVRNRAQMLLPVMKSGFRRALNERKAYVEKSYQLEDNTTRSYKSAVEDGFKKAGLTYTQVHGETGQTLDITETYQRMNDLLLERIKVGKGKMWTLEKSRELSDLTSKIAEISSSASYNYKGKTRRLLPKAVAFSGAELANRQYAFRLGFHPVFEYYMDLYQRANSGLTTSQAIDLASAKAIEAGKKMVDLTQFDYHSYNSPEIMRKRGIGGATLRLATQFKKFTINNYKLTKEVLFEAMMEAKENKGKERIINEKAGIAANFIVTHLLLLGISGATGWNIYNYIKDDMAGYVFNLFKWITGQKTDYITQKETPIPYAMGPVFGDLTSLGLIAADVSENTMEDWLVYHAAPRGPRNMYRTAKDVIGNTSPDKKMLAILRMAGLTKDFTYEHGK